MASPLVISVILNTNRRDDTVACLASLQHATYANHRIIVLDNASTDGSREAIAAAFPSVQIMGLAENRGYTGNNNVGVAEAIRQGADWVFVLNEDTVLAPDCIERLVAAGERMSGVGIVGPLVLHHDEPEVIQSAGGQIDCFWNASHRGQNQPAATAPSAQTEADWVSGCAIMVRRAVIEQVGALDERFFYYWEEIEWCVRTRRAGWTIVLVPEARIWHKGVQRDYRPKASVSYYDTRNRFLMMHKHRAPLVAWIAAAVQKLRTIASYSLRPKWRGRRDHRDAMLQGLRDFLRGRFGPLGQPVGRRTG